jgi:NADH-quinone oxidoreductase subunit D
MQGLGYVDRLDYVSVVQNEGVYIGALEGGLQIGLGIGISGGRTLVLEVMRVLNGMLAVTCGLLDIGSISPLLWAFEERDKLLT